MYKSCRNGSAGFPHFDYGRQSEISESRSPRSDRCERRPPGGWNPRGRASPATSRPSTARRSPARHPGFSNSAAVSSLRSAFPAPSSPDRPSTAKGRLDNEGEELDRRRSSSGRGRIGRLPSKAVGMRVSRTLANVRFMPFAHAPAGRCRGLPTLDARLRRCMSGPRRSSAEGEENRILFRRGSLDGRSRRRRARFGGGMRQRRAS